MLLNDILEGEGVKEGVRLEEIEEPAVKTGVAMWAVRGTCLSHAAAQAFSMVLPAIFPLRTMQ